MPRSPASYGRRMYEKHGGILDVDRDVYREKEYAIWTDMLLRCDPESVSSKPKLASYIGCSFDESFRRYSDFYAWIHPRWASGFNLDKDIKMRGNKVYGASNCLVVSARINKAFQLKSRVNEMPSGVKARPGGKFCAMLRDVDGREWHRNFGTVEEAHYVWQMNKADVLLQLIGKESDEAKPFIQLRIEKLVDDASRGILTKGVL